MIALKLLGIFLSILSLVSSEVLVSGDRKSTLNISIVKKDGLLIKLKTGNETKLSGHIGNNLDVSGMSCQNQQSCFLFNKNFSLSILAKTSSFEVNWVSVEPRLQVFNDCLDLNGTNNVSWYGGPEVWLTSWPIEKLTLKNRSYISSKLDNGALIERYWLNSKGGFIFVNSSVPLFVDQNNERKDKVCFKGAARSPYQGKKAALSYILAAKNNSKDAHMYAVTSYLGRPKGLPDYKMIKEPIWTTWGKYKAAITDGSVREYLKNIYSHNFTKGQIEIDDKWEVCYGAQTFDNKTKFKDIKNTVSIIHQYGFRATLWTHPFVNTDCKPAVTEGIKYGYFVNSTTGNSTTSWWNGASAYVIDFTNPNASKWFKNKLLDLRKNYGIDGFKCDAGENDWLPEKPIFFRNYSDAPNAFTRLYLNVCAELGNNTEVRSGYRTQNLSVFVRMLDRDSVWGNNNGLKSIVHSLLQFNMIGYTFVLPDLVGGNGYNQLPTSELLVRWTQANTFMPAIQFSYLPWELNKTDFNATNIVRKFIDIRYQYFSVINETMRNSSRFGVPVNPPIWWLDPNDPIALKVDDEFLLGEKILVAPILNEGAKFRDVYLPKGRWRDGNNGTIYAGGRYLKHYAAPIDVLPYFLRL